MLRNFHLHVLRVCLNFTVRLYCDVFWCKSIESVPNIGLIAMLFAAYNDSNS